MFAVSISGKPERGCFVFGFASGRKPQWCQLPPHRGKKHIASHTAFVSKLKSSFSKLRVSSLAGLFLYVCERESSKQRCMQMPTRLPCVCTKKKEGRHSRRLRLHPFYGKGKRPIREGTKLRFQIRCPERLLFRLPWTFTLCCSNKEPRSILMSSEGRLYPSQQTLWGSPSLRGESSF